MSSILTTAFLGSAVVAGSIFGLTLAQNTTTPMKPCIGENCPPSGVQQGAPKKAVKGVEQNNQEPGQPNGQPLRKKKMMGVQQNNQTNVGVAAGTQQQTLRQTTWRFDPSHEQRRRSRSVTFRFYFAGYWYPEPYWQVYAVRRYRVSCGEGRAIVAQRFNRVRVVECNGGTYTYLGRRHGETFRILVNARNGRIVGIAHVMA